MKSITKYTNITKRYVRLANKDKKYSLYGTAKIGEKGQIVIPKEAREEFGLTPGDVVIIVGGNGQGIGVMKSNSMDEIISKTFSKILEEDKK
jgi:AbrB family looped-hinge helix DNA binding protein